jgi:hypothetical protein
LDFFSLSPTRIEKEDCLYDLILGLAGKYLPKLWARKQSPGVALKPLTQKAENTYSPDEGILFYIQSFFEIQNDNWFNHNSL